jgi:hypothetical protein
VSDLGAALLESLSDDDLRDLAEKLRPHLAPPADENGWLRGARRIGDYMGAPRSRVYSLVSAGRIPCVERDGASLIARREDLDHWLRNGGAKRP